MVEGDKPPKKNRQASSSEGNGIDQYDTLFLHSNETSGVPKRRNHEEHCSDNLHAVSIKEDMAYMCPKLHSAPTKEISIRRIQKKPYAVFKVQVMEYSGI
ncbi:hypothetical protein Tco_0658200 [Tanacetum coccineum]